MSNEKPLLIAGCWHFGHRNADLKMAQRYIDFVKSEKADVLLLSDNFENVIPKKGHMMFDQILTPQEQLELGEKLFYPIRKQIVGLVQGNHSNRTRHEAGINMDYELAKALGVKENYFENQGFVNVEAGKQNYSVAFRHGANAGVDVFRNCTLVARQFPGADIAACSHTHLMATTTLGFWMIEDKKRVRHETTLINTGSLLDYPSYADEAYYAPQKKGFAIAWLNTKEKQVRVDVTGVV